LLTNDFHSKAINDSHGCPTDAAADHQQREQQKTNDKSNSCGNGYVVKIGPIRMNSLAKYIHVNFTNSFVYLLVANIEQFYRIRNKEV
jgi:hypothetical protein